MSSEASKRIVELPELVPVLPVRNTVLFPNAAVPLIVGRPKSIEAIHLAQKGADLCLVVTQKDGGQDEPGHEELFKIGVICLLTKVSRSESESYQLIANGLFRFRVSEYVDGPNVLLARGVQLAEVISTSDTTQTLANEVKQLGKAILNLTAIPGADSLIKLFSQLQDTSQIADLCCTFLNLPVAVKQKLLEMQNLDTRLERLIEHMIREKERLTLQNEIQSKMMERLSKDQRDHLLREQLRTIHEELGDEGNIGDDFGKKIEECGMTDEAKKVAKEELARLAMIPRASPEYHVIRTYLDWLTALPWKSESATGPDKIVLQNARKILDEDHYGIEKVKNRIIQFLAVNKLKKDMKGPILCLLGPPGVGKTSVAKSVAKALGRKFIRTSLGGVRDEAEIRGHRRTYIGAMPGRIIQSIKRAGVKDPLILLDEIDKIGIDFRGDPASALLEILDPEQNHSFMDHYIDVPFDLSKSFFITTANIVETIPPALRDRLEIIEMSSYSKNEKMHIATRYLVPRVLEEHGMTSEQLKLPEETISSVIDGYTREAGVRQLFRELSHLARAAAEDLAKENPVTGVIIVPKDLDRILGHQKFFAEDVITLLRPGVVTGLAWTPVGGEILHVEAAKMEGKGNLLLTGHLGDVMKESAQIALSLVRSEKSGRPLVMDKFDFHIHVPSGAIPKDGPSAGSAIFLALTSLLEQKSVPPKLAVTGEITLRGAVMPVGGIKEKVLAAHRAGVETIILPRRNEGELREVPQEVREQLKFHFVENIQELLKLVQLGESNTLKATASSSRRSPPPSAFPPPVAN